MKNIHIPIVAIDFEGSRSIGVVEYGAAEFIGGEVVRTHTRVCRPRSPIPLRDAAFFDISNDAAGLCEPFEKDLPLFFDLRKRGVFAAHNASVEDSFLRMYAPTPALVPDFVRGGETAAWAPWLDSYIFCKNIYPTLQSHKLLDMVGFFGLTERLDEAASLFCPAGRRKWHCALFDAIACGLIYSAVCSMQGFENVTLPWLAKYSGTPDSQQTDFGADLF